MAEEWFYTTNKQQMGPVSWKELVELADVGILKPHDMVWTEGMDEWVKAINKKGLFTEGADEEVATSGNKKSSYTESKPPPGRRTRPKEEDDDDEDDSKEAKKANRKRQEDRAKMAIGLKVGLILGGVLLALFVGVGCVGGIIWISFSGGIGGGKGNETGVPRNYTINNLPQNKFDDRRPSFTQGKRVIVTVTNTLDNPNTDVNLWVLRGTNEVPNERPLIADERRPNEDRNCRVEFVVPANDVYRVRVINKGPGTARTCIVNIEEN